MTRHATYVFWIALAFGVISATLLYRSAQTNSGCSVSGSYDPNALSDKDKVYIDRFTDNSKWLETIAYGTLVGVIIMGLKNRSMLTGNAVNFGSALLIVSVYTSFLSQDAVLFALSKGPVCLLYGDVTRWLLICQVWSLIAAIGSLAIWFLRGKHLVSLAVLSAFLLTIPTAGASIIEQQQDPGTGGTADTSPINKSCIVSWVKTQYDAKPTDGEIQMMGSLILSVATKAQVPRSTFQSCTFVAAALDQVRWAAYNVGPPDYKSFVKYAGGITSDISASHWSQGTFLSSLLSAAELWRTKSGLIVVKSKIPGLVVSIDDNQVGLTTYVYRAACGAHTVTVRKGMQTVLNRTVDISDGQQVDLQTDSE
jgi:hypothetical protein